jgi:hypothetical protein
MGILNLRRFWCNALAGQRQLYATLPVPVVVAPVADRHVAIQLTSNDAVTALPGQGPWFHVTSRGPVATPNAELGNRGTDDVGRLFHSAQAEAVWGVKS